MIILSIIFASLLSLSYNVNHGSALLTSSFEFLVSSRKTDRYRAIPKDGYFMASKDSDDHESEETHANESKIPQLPAFGATSKGMLYNEPSSPATAFVGSRKFELQYTCAICETRNCHRVSRLAYRKGVVITTCKGCGNKHLIADNLGWTDHDGGFQGDINTIEDYFAQNDSNKTEVNRVSADVFNLEKVLSHDTKSGSIVGEDGSPALE